MGVAEADEEEVCRMKVETPLGCNGRLSDNLLSLRLPPAADAVLAGVIVSLGGGDIVVHVAISAPSWLIVRAGDMGISVCVAPAKN